jgi:hypothetical protein
MSTTLTVILLVMSLPGVAGIEPDEAGIDKLEVVEQTRNSHFLANPTAQWSRYTKIHLERSSVEFRKNWARDQQIRNGNRVREEDIDRIKNSLADLLEQVFTRELTTRGGYVMSESDGADVIRITPRIVKLDIYAPDRVRDYIGQSLTYSSGHMTLELDIFDSQSKELLARSSEREDDLWDGHLEWTNSVTNTRDARLMLQRLATGLRERLDHARAP